VFRQADQQAGAECDRQHDDDEQRSRQVKAWKVVVGNVELHGRLGVS
jgi:hypothetical protein